MKKTSGIYQHTLHFHTFVKKIIVVITLCIACLPMLLGQARMVRNIKPGPGPTQPQNLNAYKSVAIGNTLYFSASNPAFGEELWKTDGTEAGTVLVKDITDGYLSTRITDFTNMNGTLFFSASSWTGSNAGLWKSDGTAAGTVLVKALTGIGANNFTRHPAMIEMNGVLFFVANDGVSGQELWRSDGTAAGTQMIKDINPGRESSRPAYLTKMGNTLFFTAEDGTDIELWKTDGTLTGTVKAVDLVPGRGSGNPTELTNINGTLFFNALGVINGVFTGNELWKSDGTAAGTVLVRDILPGTGSSNPINLANVNGTLVFQADVGTNGIELWKSNGTAAGTVLVKDINPGLSNTNIINPVSIDGIWFFMASTNAEGFELWRSDGTEAGTTLFRDFKPGPESSFPFIHHVIGNTFVFSCITSTNGLELWISDGTQAGTRLIRDIRVGPQNAEILVLERLGNTIFTFANDGIVGDALWKTNGTTAGTVLVKDINTDGASSEINSIFSYKGNAFFSAVDGITGAELWRSDGTEAGTFTFDLRRGPTSSLPGEFAECRGSLFFQALNAQPDNSLINEVWRSNGTITGTSTVKTTSGMPLSNPFQFTNVEGTLFFIARNNTLGSLELWRTDGTAANTLLVRNITQRFWFTSLPHKLFNLNSTLIFTAYNSDFQDPPSNFSTEIWSSDGTAFGTLLIKSINTGKQPSSPSHFTIFRNGLYFFVNDGENGQELWRTDGSSEGTILVKDINPGPAGFDATQMIAIGNTLYMTGTSTNGTELWKSDGTTNGTVLVRDIWPGNQSSSPQDLFNMNGTLLFRAATPEQGMELWKSDGTSAGTVLVRDITPGTNGGMRLPSVSAEFTQMGNLIYFKADNGTNGTELWQTDGTTAGTRMVQDISPGSSPSLIGPSYFRNVDGALYFTATDGIHGLELWRFAPSSSTAETFTQTLKIFPNPVQDRIFIEKPSDVEGQLMVRIFDITGQLVQTATYVATPVLEVKTEALRPGVYVVELNNAVGVRLGVQKMIKLEP